MNESTVVDYRKTHTMKETREKFGIPDSRLRQILKSSSDWQEHTSRKGNGIVVTDEQIDEAIRVVRAEYGNVLKSAKVLGIPEPTLRTRLRIAAERGLWQPDELDQVRSDKLSFENAKLKKRLDEISENNLTQEEIRQFVYKLSGIDPTPPQWLISTKSLPKSFPGVPSLLCSDVHWGEVVDPTQINNVNQYNLEIATLRIRRLIERTIQTLTTELSNPTYPGIVFNMGGDMFSGEIHDELIATNQGTTIQVFQSLYEIFIWAIDRLAEHFNQVFVVSVSGNHPRTTKKVASKNYNGLNFDTLLATQLESHFKMKKDKRVSFYVPNGTDALYRVYDYRYNLTHGNQFRGGDGMIGPIGPITRGDHKKRSKNAQISMEYDTLLMGHFHTLMMLNRFIVNGSVVGYNEFSSMNNFTFEKPQQALWLTKPGEGITFRKAILLSDDYIPEDRLWVSVPFGA